MSKKEDNGLVAYARKLEAEILELKARIATLQDIVYRMFQDRKDS